MKTSRFYIILTVVAAGLVAAAWAAGSSQAQAPIDSVDLLPAGGTPTWTFTYQGRLEAGGQPANGFYDMKFSFWDTSSGGNQLGATAVYDVEGILVTDGIFSVNVPPGDRNVIFNGGDRWLQIEARPHLQGSYTTLPRQPVTGVPYAWSLRPGAVISGTTTPSYPILKVNADGGPALYGYSQDDTGVNGQTDGTGSTDYGVHGAGGGMAYGVFGHNLGSSGGLGVYGKNEGGGSGLSGYNAGYGNGTWGYSVGYNGIGAGTSRADSNYGLYTSNNMYSANYHMAGAVMQVAQNGGLESLERGDVVVIAGIDKASPMVGAPILKVSKPSAADSTAVVGVVASDYPAEWLASAANLDPTGANLPNAEIPLSGPGPIAPGAYLLVVVQGPAQVKAQALDAAIRPGDLLSTAVDGGYAGRAASFDADGKAVALPGTVFAKALEALTSGQRGLIYVYVTLQ